MRAGLSRGVGRSTCGLVSTQSLILWVVGVGRKSDPPAQSHKPLSTRRTVTRDLRVVGSFFVVALALDCHTTFGDSKHPKNRARPLTGWPTVYPWFYCGRHRLAHQGFPRRFNLWTVPTLLCVWACRSSVQFAEWFEPVLSGTSSFPLNRRPMIFRTNF